MEKQINPSTAKGNRCSSWAEAIVLDLLPGLLHTPPLGGTINAFGPDHAPAPGPPSGLPPWCPSGTQMVTTPAHASTSPWLISPAQAATPQLPQRQQVPSLPPTSWLGRAVGPQHGPAISSLPSQQLHLLLLLLPSSPPGARSRSTRPPKTKFLLRKPFFPL